LPATEAATAFPRRELTVKKPLRTPAKKTARTSAPTSKRTSGASTSEQDRIRQSHTATKLYDAIRCLVGKGSIEHRLRLAWIWHLSPIDKDELNRLGRDVSSQKLNATIERAGLDSGQDTANIAEELVDIYANLMLGVQR
jgi:hypothetical protein